MQNISCRISEARAFNLLLPTLSGFQYPSRPCILQLSSSSLKMGKGKNHVKTPTASKVGGSNGIKKVKGENFYRDAKSASRVKMLNGGKAVRDKDGKIIQAAAFQKGEKETEMGRIQADRRWFGEFHVLPIPYIIANSPSQATPESSPKRHSTTSELPSPNSEPIHIPSCCVGTSFPWAFSRTKARTPVASVFTSPRLSLSTIPLARKHRGRGRGWISEAWRS